MRERTTILVVDNYDSFAYNLVQYVGEVADEVVVRRNDEIDLEGVADLEPTGIVVSPGPGTPAEAGISIPLFAETTYPILGVCLGHQALCAANGAPVVHAPEVVHGKPSLLTHDGAGIFAGVPDPVQVGRYHSLAVGREELPTPLEAVARTADERAVLMAVRHRERPHIGVQFHPESILTRAPTAKASDKQTVPEESTERTAAETAAGRPSADEDGARGESISLSVGKRLIRNFCELAAETSGRTAGSDAVDSR